MFSKMKSAGCEAKSAAASTIAQALVWAAVTIAVAVELRGSPAAGQVMLWLSFGAFSSLLISSGRNPRSRRDDCDGRDGRDGRDRRDAS